MSCISCIRVLSVENLTETITPVEDRTRRREYLENIFHTKHFRCHVSRGNQTKKFTTKHKSNILILKLTKGFQTNTSNKMQFYTILQTNHIQTNTVDKICSDKHAKQNTFKQTYQTYLDIFRHRIFFYKYIEKITIRLISLFKLGSKTPCKKCALSNLHVKQRFQFLQKKYVENITFIECSKRMFFVKTRINLVKQFQKLIFTFSQHRSYKTLFNYLYLSLFRNWFSKMNQSFSVEILIFADHLILVKYIFFHSTIFLSGKI